LLLWHGGISATLGFTGWAKRSRSGDYALAVTARRERLMGGEAYWYLLLAGALPGAGREERLKEVLRPVLQLADKQKRSCYTEVTDRANVPVLESLGFEVATDHGYYEDMTLFGLSVWLMRRTPGASARADSAV
jgi:hypothetical protein